MLPPGGDDHRPSSSERDRSRLNNVEAWIFDLDNTLYPASSSLFPQIDLRMRQFISMTLDIDLDEAYRLQKSYYREYGTTLRGLMLVHGIEPGVYLEYVHDIDHSVLVPAPALAAALSVLPGRRFVFTNGSERHAEKVIARLGLQGCFDGIFDIAAAAYVPKPDAQAYRALAARHGIDPQRAAMFEDLVRNLKPAAEAGMTTVLVQDPGAALDEAALKRDFPFLHHVTSDLAGWLGRVRLS